MAIFYCMVVYGYMSSIFFIHTITIYHLDDEDNATRQVYSNVYFRHNKKANVIDKGIERASSGSITIPTTDDLNISIGDIVIEGIIEDDYDYRTLMNTYHLYKVLSIDDNRKGHLQHWKLGVTD